MSPSYKDFRHNFIVNMFDGGFFGLALGFASFITILPLFVSTMTASATLIGLIPAIHSMGWQLPQLFIASRVARLSRYKPMVVWTTLHERLPFLALAGVAWAIPVLGIKTALVLTFAILVWQGLGGGFTATAWQAMIAKIIPPDRQGTFFGFQSGMANLLMSGSAVAAGLLLERLDSPLDFTLCFLFAGLAMGISLVFLAQVREDSTPPQGIPTSPASFFRSLLGILRRDRNFRWFLVVRSLSQFAVMAVSFFTIYAVRRHAMTESIAGVMMGVSTVGQIIANPLMGWIGDRWNHPAVLKVGALAATLSALIAWAAPSLAWFYLVFLLSGIAFVSMWTIGLAMTLQFGSESDRPAYIGMANTLVAPSTILAPIIGGWLADTAGFQATFFVSALSGLATVMVLQFTLQDPRKTGQEQVESSSAD